MIYLFVVSVPNWLLSFLLGVSLFDLVHGYATGKWPTFWIGLGGICLMTTLKTLRRAIIEEASRQKGMQDDN
jgi:hypothetical protein